MEILHSTDFALLASGVSLFMLVAYIAVFCVCRGVPKSLSASYYMLKHHVLFTLTLWGSALAGLPGFVLAGRPHTQWFVFLSAAGAFLVGAAPRFRERHQRPVHTLGFLLAIIGSTAWTAFNLPVMLALWVAFPLYLVFRFIFRPRKFVPIFVAEVIALAIFYGALFVRLAQRWTA